MYNVFIDGIHNIINLNNYDMNKYEDEFKRYLKYSVQNSSITTKYDVGKRIEPIFNFTSLGNNEVYSELIKHCDADYINLNGYSTKYFDYECVNPEEMPMFFFKDKIHDANDHLRHFFEYIKSNIKESPTYIFYSIKIHYFLANYQSNYVILKWLRDQYPDSKIVIGGSLIRLEETDLKEKFDKLNLKFVVGDDIKQFFDKLFTGDGCVTSNFDKKKTIYNDLVLEESDLVSIPYKQILEKYGLTTDSDKELKQFESILSYGCTGQCAFCVSSDHKLKLFDIDCVIKFIKSYVDKGYNSMMDLTCALNSSITWLRKFCNALIENNINMIWSTSLRVDNLKEADCELLFRAGCRIVYLGCETVDDAHLSYIGKRVDVATMKQSIKFLHNAGLWVHTNYILNMPYFNENEFENIQTFIDECGGHSVVNTKTFNIFRLISTSRFYTNPKKYDLVLLNDIYWEKNRYKPHEVEKIKLTTIYENIYLLENYTNFKFNQNLIFVLYDLYKTKSNVLNVLRSNFETIANLKN